MSQRSPNLEQPIPRIATLSLMPVAITHSFNSGSGSKVCRNSPVKVGKRASGADDFGPTAGEILGGVARVHDQLRPRDKRSIVDIAVVRCDERGVELRDRRLVEGHALHALEASMFAR